MSDSDMRIVHVASPVREQLAIKLREAIADMRFLPGRRLVERDLIEMTGASRTSVREALRQLEAEGLVRTIPHKGTFVVLPTKEEAEELFDIRASLEAIAARRFTEKSTDKELVVLRKTLDEVTADRDVGKLLKIKDEFYRLLGSKSPLVYAMLSTLHIRIAMLRGASLSAENRVRSSRAELEALVAAIEKRDTDAAAKAAQYHVEQAAEACFRTLSEGDG